VFDHVQLAKHYKYGSLHHQAGYPTENRGIQSSENQAVSKEYSLLSRKVRVYAKILFPGDDYNVPAPKAKRRENC